MFVPGKPFQSSLMFAGEVVALGRLLAYKHRVFHHTNKKSIIFEYETKRFYYFKANVLCHELGYLKALNLAASKKVSTAGETFLLVGF